MRIPKCSECEHHKRTLSVTFGRPRHECVAADSRVISYNDKKFPKASPMWCPKRRHRNATGTTL